MFYDKKINVVLMQYTYDLIYRGVGMGSSNFDLMLFILFQCPNNPMNAKYLNNFHVLPLPNIPFN